MTILDLVLPMQVVLLGNIIFALQVTYFVVADVRLKLRIKIPLVISSIVIGLVDVTLWYNLSNVELMVY